MALLAATATTTDTALAYLVLFLVAAVWIAGYFLACWLWPFVACRRCTGSGKRRSPTGRAFRLCRRCDGTGRQLRIGRRIHNALRGHYDKADR